MQPRIQNTVTRWFVETSHLFTPPQFFDASSLKELRAHVQLAADRKPKRKGIPAMGTIHFRYELDENEQVEVVHAFFTNRHDKLTRFMRLRREETPTQSSETPNAA